MSSPPVISGNPGMTNSIAPIYAVSCCKAIGSNRPISRSMPVHASAATATQTNVTKNWLRWWANRRRRSQWPRPAPTNAPIMSYGPPPSRNTKDAQAQAERESREGRRIQRFATFDHVESLVRLPYGDALRFARGFPDMVEMLGIFLRRFAVAVLTRLFSRPNRHCYVRPRPPPRYRACAADVRWNRLPARVP